MKQTHLVVQHKPIAAIQAAVVIVHVIAVVIAERQKMAAAKIQ